MVLRREAAAHIQDKHHHIGLGDCLARLFGHFLIDAGACIGLEAAGIHNDVLVRALPAVAVMAVASQTRSIRDDGVTRAGQPIEQRGLADIGSPHEGDHWFHKASPSQSGRKP